LICDDEEDPREVLLYTSLISTHDSDALLI